MSDSERKHREAKAMQERIAAGDRPDEVQEAAVEQARGRSVWDEGPERTPAQKRAHEIAVRDAAVRADMDRDARGAFGPDGQWRWASDWRPV